MWAMTARKLNSSRQILLQPLSQSATLHQPRLRWQPPHPTHLQALISKLQATQETLRFPIRRYLQKLLLKTSLCIKKALLTAKMSISSLLPLSPTSNLPVPELTTISPLMTVLLPIQSARRQEMTGSPITARKIKSTWARAMTSCSALTILIRFLQARATITFMLQAIQTRFSVLREMTLLKLRAVKATLSTPMQAMTLSWSPTQSL